MVVLRLIVFERSYFDFIYIYYGLVFKGGLVFVITKTKRVFVFEITKTKTPKFTVKFDLKLGGKNRREDNLTD